MIVNNNRIAIRIVDYNYKTFIVQAKGVNFINVLGMQFTAIER
jgi:hypothetical protein